MEIRKSGIEPDENECLGTVRGFRETAVAVRETAVEGEEGKSISGDLVSRDKNKPLATLLNASPC